MASVAVLPAIALLAGAAAGTASPWTFAGVCWGLPALCLAALLAWRQRARKVTHAILLAGFCAAGAVLAADARVRAVHPPLRAALDAALGGFHIDTLGPEPDHDPLLVRAVLDEDAAARDGYVSIRARITALAIDGRWIAADGGVSLAVGGEAAARRIDDWRAGRAIEAPATFRRPARYLNEGVPDFERDLALDGIALFGSIKSGLLVEVIAHGGALDEAAAEVRAHVRRAVARWIAPHGDVPAAIVVAVLIGDRTGLPDEVRDRLQAGGTYHVIAISGGNIAILTALVLGLLMTVAVQGRAAAGAAIAVLLVYAQIATAGPSVWRATLMAVVYLGARLLDHRTAPWQATAVAAALMVVVRPLDIRDAGFILTFGATVALLEGARRGARLLGGRRVVAWTAASILASLATEIALVPVSAQVFSRVTSAGLVLNLLAVPMMAVAQVAGLVVAGFTAVEPIAAAAGWTASMAARVLVDSARLVEAAPWLARRVPPPGLAIVIAYYLALAAVLFGRGRAIRAGAALPAAVCLLLIAGWRPFQPAGAQPDGMLRWTIFDVGQGEAMLIESTAGTLQIDAGGAPFGSGAFDIGARVLAPALWARGVRRLETLLVTHGDPDHIGGARALLEAFGVRRFWEGVQVPAHAPSAALRAHAAAGGAALSARRAGEVFDEAGLRIRVLHPPEPDWERPRVRNDDSVVLEVLYGEVALLLTGDAGADVERAVIPQLTPARVRVLKVGHHGSRTSTSAALVEAWRPQIAIVSAGRGNTFGHPTPEVLQRLTAIGARIYRTDRHGQITVTTDGDRIDVRTYVDP